MASCLNLLILLCTILNPSLVLLTTATLSFNESCTPGAPPCQALLAYKIPDNTSLASISSLFSVRARDILSVNGFSPAANVSALLSDETVKIMLPCPCVQSLRTGTGVINYTVVPGDGLFIISQKFGSFVTYQEIAAVNNVPDPDKISVGQNLSIPYPCACQENMLNGRDVLFMSYVVQQGETAAALARQYGISVSEFERLNPSVAFEAGAVIELPVESCKARFNKDATDGNLTVPGGGYAITANGCVQCSCTNGQLYCTKSPSAASSCSLRCESSSLEIGKFNTSANGGRCVVDSCLYDGYRSNTIFTRIEKNTTGVGCEDVGAPPTFAYAPEEQGVPEAISPTGGGTAPPPLLNTPPSPATSVGAPPPTSGSITWTPVLPCMDMKTNINASSSA